MTDEREFREGRADLSGQTDTLTRKIVFAGAIFAAMAIGIAWIMASRMSRSIRSLARVANFQSRGDIAAAEKILSGKSSVVAEFDELFKAVLLMARSLTRLISALKLRGEDGAERAGRIYQFDISRIASDGKPIGTVILAFDITEQEFAERNRREFTANVSHELKTPLQGIIGSAELIENGMVKPDDLPRFVGPVSYTHLRAHET